MAKIVGTIYTTHVPAIGNAIRNNLQGDPYWKPFFDGFNFVHDWVAQVQPTVAVVFYNDHGLGFWLDALPTFAIGCAPEYKTKDEGWGIPTFTDFDGDTDLSWHIAEAVKRADFDVVTCQELYFDHALAIPMELTWPGVQRPIKIVPIEINTVLFPTPSAARCLALGRAVGKAIESYDKDERVLVFGTGGLSHQLEGERAGFINKKFDLEFVDSLPTNPEWATQFTPEEIAENTGTQGVELINWLAARGTIEGDAKTLHMNYHIPISDTAACTMVQVAA
ncbi:MAG: class III extradiol dioxygenase family protein [Propionibacteriaceae bacterium]|nr:class III extradiol dioxygenase family protein [Propionibacteriaceae bacterium]